LVALSGITLLLITGCGGSVSPLGPSNPTQPACSAGVTSAPAAQNKWTWMSGANIANQAGTYGTLGVAAATNTPGARVYPVSWTDKCGVLWLFGGYGAASTFSQGDLNDLWKLSGNQWTWVSGSNLTEQSGVYGTLGVASAANVPGARWQAVSWTDPQGNLWLFGGLGRDSAGNRGDLNDLWKYANGQWTWIAGANVINQPGVYGTEGVAAATNVPGARTSAVTWTDASGNLWLFGGGGYTSATSAGDLNDLWKFSAGQWTWVSGSNQIGQLGTYGTQGVAYPANIPGARDSASSWIDPSGNLWLFGGEASGENLNDLWEYQP
jgi:N-acetylneuraminic acid mutarotase